MIKKLILDNFKNISHLETELEPINVLIGENNSGKSSVLQGIHFCVMAEVVRRKLQKTNFPENALLYVPSSDMLYLRHDEPYTVSSGHTSTLTLQEDENGNSQFSITIAKGRNDGNLSVNVSGNNTFRQSVTSFNPLYCMYVPGVSGIPVREKYVTPAELRSAVARGDANMYIRNIIYQLQRNGKLDDLNNELHRVFPGYRLGVVYNPDEDIYIRIILNDYSEGKKNELPFEQAGTGVLQVVQILAYALYFSPKMLLLDEPDEHLHPDNQAILAEVIKYMASSKDIQIILATHSRHLLSALGDDSKIIWLKNGSVQEEKGNLWKYQILMDIGALDRFDQVIGGKYHTVFLTEDRDTEMCRILLEHNGLGDAFVFSYSGCGNLETAKSIASLIHKSSPDCTIIIHRDRDFMTDEEVSKIENQISESSVIPFITKGSDIESYFYSAEHISACTGLSLEDAQNWIQELIDDNQVSLTIDFTTKRTEAKNKIRDTNPESTKKLLKNGLSVDTVKGKALKKLINGDCFNHVGKQVDFLVDTPDLDIPELMQLAQK